MMYCYVPCQMACCRTPWHAAICRHTPPHAAARRRTPPHAAAAAARRGTPWHAAARRGTPWHAVARRSTPRHAATRRGTPWHAKAQWLSEPSGGGLVCSAASRWCCHLLGTSLHDPYTAYVSRRYTADAMGSLMELLQTCKQHARETIRPR